jgi:hypothetical protein
LDLEVISPTGRRYIPWRLDPANPSAPARNDCASARDGQIPASCRNRVDNVEVVDIAAKFQEGGDWTIKVTGPANGVNQAFALATYGLDVGEQSH